MCYSQVNINNIKIASTIGSVNASTLNNPNFYTWSEISNAKQRVHISVIPAGKGEIYSRRNIAIDKDENVANYTLRRKLNSCIQDASIVSLGISGTYYFTNDNGNVIGISVNISFHLNQISSFTGIIRRGIGAPIFGAAEPRQEWYNDISSFTEITFLYQHNFHGILNGFLLGSGLSHIFGKMENDTKYSYISLPIVLRNEFKLIHSLYFNLGINSNINKKLILWGFDLGLLYKL
jgi:hypothetical protein